MGDGDGDDGYDESGGGYQVRHSPGRPGGITRALMWIGRRWAVQVRTLHCPASLGSGSVAYLFMETLGSGSVPVHGAGGCGFDSDWCLQLPVQEPSCIPHGAFVEEKEPSCNWIYVYIYRVSQN